MALVQFLAADMDFVVRPIGEPNAQGWQRIQVADLRLTGKPIKKRFYYLQHNGQRFAQGAEYFSLQARDPGTLDLIANVVLGHPETSAAEKRNAKVVHFLDERRRRSGNNSGLGKARA